jgi:hypothetical protein
MSVTNMGRVDGQRAPKQAMSLPRLAIVAFALSWSSPAWAQVPEDLQQQLQALKKQYEETAQELQRRIAALEQQIQATSEATTASAEQAGREAADKAVQRGVLNVGQQYQGQLPSPPTYDLLREAETKIEGLEEQMRSFEFHGYFRSGYGLNSVGGQQVAFQAPGAGAKFRLGNETETYSESIFVNNWLNPERNSDKAWLKTEVMIEANTTNSASYTNFNTPAGNDQFRLREAFVRAGNFFESQPDLKVWGGERYYRRQHIEIDDFYPLDMSGYGGGVEDIHAGIGKIAFSYLGGARPDIETPNGNYAKSNLDLRLYDVKAPGGTVALWADFATSKGGPTATGLVVPSNSGYAVGLKHQRLEWHGGYHQFFIQYGTGRQQLQHEHRRPDSISRQRGALPRHRARPPPAERPFRHHAGRRLPAEARWQSPARLGRVGVDRRAAAGLLHQACLPGVRGGFRPYQERHGPVRRLAPKVHLRPADRSGPQVLQPARAAGFRHLRDLVRRAPRLRGRRPLQEQDERAHLRCPGRDMVVALPIGGDTRRAAST